MNRQLTAVLQTYTTRRSVQILVALGGVLYLLMFFAALADSRHTQIDSEGVLGILAYPAMIFAYILASQAKWQFVDPRARLLPRFATNHLAGLAGLALLSLGLAPAFLGWAARANMLGSAACTIVMASSLIWLIQGKAAPALLLGLGMLALMIRPGVAFWLTPENASLYWPYRLALLAAGWAAFGGWLVRLVNLREEQGDYSLPIFIQSGSATRMQRTQASRTAARLFPNSSHGSASWLPGDKWHDRLAGIRATSAGARQRLLRYGFAQAPAWHTAVGLVVGFAAMMGVISIFRPHLLSSDANLSYFSMMILMPTMIAPGMLIARRGKMSQELLLPLVRRTYIDGLLAALARNSTVIWAITHAALLTMISLMAPQTMSVSFVIALTTLSLSAHLYAFGVFTWIAQTQSAGRRLVAAILVGLPAIGVVSAGINSIAVKPPPPPLHSSIPASLEQHLSAEQRAIIEQHIHRQNEQLRKSRETSPAVAWSIAASLATVGAIAYATGRRKWLDAELA